eukprot:tig00021433_g21285.t1
MWERDKEELKAELAKQTDELQRQQAKLENERNQKAEEVEVLRKKFSPLNKIITLNVGGKIFQVGSETLKASVDSIFPAILSGGYDIKKDEKGAIFLDRAPDAFRFVLSWLRDGPAWLNEAKVAALPIWLRYA